MNITISKENYLKSIAEAESEGEVVIAATLSRWLQVSPPAVTAGVRRLKRDGLIVTRKDGTITLTKNGRAIADRLLLRHHLVERMLTEMFGMMWYQVHDEAERLEHAVSEDFERQLLTVLGREKPCPHGNRIGPDTPEDRRKRGWKLLHELNGPGDFVVMSVFERDRKLLEFLDTLGLRPGAFIRWNRRNYDETVDLTINGKCIPLGGPAAARIWVAAAPGAAERACAEATATPDGSRRPAPGRSKLVRT
ncbi:MAG TPA: iron dependent repressor, metal binding and dimerization domain protein [Bryobacteraceae bacterium]|nr:iron dependent repressor, metal binding and dimerization domain protein [Bryobacteraceae bacterium]